LAPADFRDDTLQWWCRGFALPEVEISDAELTLVIAAKAQEFEGLTHDRFEAVTGPLIVDAYGTPHLSVWHRIRTLTQVETRDAAGTWTIEAAAAYRFEAFTGDILQVKVPQVVTIVPTQFLSNGHGNWPKGPGTVRLTGTFGWAAVPELVKRAVALMTYDVVKPQSQALYKTERFSLPDVTFNTATSLPTGMPEVDAIIKTFMRSHGPLVL
jgi:hypothetical protein